MKKLSILIFSFLLINSLSAQIVDSIIDIRDNQIYKIVKIGQQWWMQENLNIGTMIDIHQNETDNGIIEKYCYNNSDSLCNIYGGLYQWNEMMDYSPTDSRNPGITMGICPAGWHMSTDNEWTELVNLQGGDFIAGGRLKDTGTIHWSDPNTGATNASSFTALPGGYRQVDYNYLGIGDQAPFWSSSETGLGTAICRWINYNSINVDHIDGDKVAGYSVRCIRDASQLGYLTVSDKDLKTISKLDFVDGLKIDTIIIINSNPVKTINITSIYTGSAAYNMNKSSAVLSSGDSIYLKITFNSLEDGMYYFDTLNIESDDAYNPVIQILLKGYKPKTDSIVDIRDQQVYKIVKIGQQWWMQENLNIGIPIIYSQNAVNNGNIEKYCPDNILNNCKIYGGLYQWDEMMEYNSSDNGNPGKIRGICPPGWHLPTDTEWKELEMYLGLSQAEADAEGIRGTDEGGKLKETGTLHWNSPNTGATNESGFTALPAGNRQDNGCFYTGITAYFWSSTESFIGSAWNRDLYYVRSQVDRYNGYTPKLHGNSVRCLRDSDQFSYLTISDEHFNPVPDLKFYSSNNSKGIILINSGTEEIINISSIYKGNSVFNLNASSSSILSPGDSIHLNIEFNPLEKETYYFDTLIIESDDPFKPVIYIPLEGRKPITDSIVDIRDNQVYKVVKIGTQWWMQENLNAGNRINSSLNASNNGTIEKYCYDDISSNCNIYGGLYQWNEMMDYNSTDAGNPGVIRGICPVGWHLPTDEEWKELEIYVGMNQIEADKTDTWRGSNEGGKLKETGTIHWNDPNQDATNEFGFTALPGSCRFVTFDYLGKYADFWSSTDGGGDLVWYRGLSYTSSGVYRNKADKVYGFSVRCLRDSSQFSYLTISDLNFKPVSDLNFYGNNISEDIIVINSGVEKTINISSISTKNSAFKMNYSSSVLSSGESIHLVITFNPPVENIYPDTLFIASNDPYNPLITIPLNGTFPPEVSFNDSSNISCSGFSDGSATVTPSLGTPPYQYYWDDPSNTTDSIVTGLEANIYYRVTVTDTLGWTVTDSIRLSEPEQPLNILSEVSDTICLNSTIGYIELSPSGGTEPYNYSWSNGAETQNISGLSAGNYSVLVTDHNGCENLQEFAISSAVPYGEEKICIVTIDLMSGKNILVWEKTPDKGIAAYNIYREYGIGQFIYIGGRDVNDLSIFRDETANPESRAYLYKITVIDTCGNESSQEITPYHWPSFLQYVSSEGGINLSWTDYKIEGIDNIGDYLSSYVVYRGTDSTGLSEYDVVGRQLHYTDKDPDALVRKYYYRVAGILKDPCYPTGSSGKKDEPGPYNFSMSNIEDNRILTGLPDDIKTEILSIYPNPFRENTVLTFNNPDGYAYTLYIMDLSGKVCRIVDNISTSNYVLEKGDLQEGFYVIELRGPNLYRERIIVE